MDLRVDGVAHAALIVAAAEHGGHWRDAHLLNIFAGIQMIFDFHHHTLIFAVDDEFECAGAAFAIQQGVNGEGGVICLRRFKPERGEVRELFMTAKGVDRHATCGKTVLIGLINGTEVACTEEGNDVLAGQLGFFKRPETGKA